MLIYITTTPRQPERAKFLMFEGTKSIRNKSSDGCLKRDLAAIVHILDDHTKLKS